LAPQHGDPDREQEEVDAAEDRDRRRHLGSIDRRRHRIAGQQTLAEAIGEHPFLVEREVAGGVVIHDWIHYPRLASYLRTHPTQLVGGHCEQDGEDEDPQQPALGEERAAPVEERGEKGQADEQRADPHHRVVGQEADRDRRPVRARHAIETGHRLLGIARDEQAQQARNRDVEPDRLGRSVGPADRLRLAGAVLKCPSKAASLAGWLFATMRAFESPDTSCARLNTSARNSAPANERRAKSRCRPRNRDHADTLMTKKVPTMTAPISVCARRLTDDGPNTTPPKSATTARMIGWPAASIQGRPSRSTGTISWPAGVCCQLLATTIQTAENIEPSATMSVAKKWKRGLTRSHPNTSTARKPDSRKKAKMPSAASAEPKTSPTKREYAAQLVPNWNSITIPVATPMANVAA